MRIVLWTLWILAGLFVTYCVAVPAETVSVAMVPKAQLDALQNRYDQLEDKLRDIPGCRRFWTNARPTELSL